MKKNVLLLMLLIASPILAQRNTYQLSTHFLNISQGEVAKGVSVELFKEMPNGNWSLVTKEKTDDDGRIVNLLSYSQNNVGEYKFRIYNEQYQETFDQETFDQETVMPFIDVAFSIIDDSTYHLTLVLSGNGYVINGYRRPR